MEDTLQESNACLIDVNFNTLRKYVFTMSDDELKLFIEDVKCLLSQSDYSNRGDIWKTDIKN